MDASQLASYEHSRVAVRYKLAWKLEHIFNLNPVWLVTGKGAVFSTGVYILPDDVALASRPFSVVFDKKIRGKLPKQIPHTAPSPEHKRLVCLEVLKDRLRDWLVRVPDSALNEFVDQIEQQAELLLASFPKDTERVEWNRAIAMSKIAERLGLK